MSYSGRFANRPPCYGKEYDGNDPECTKSCAWRTSCYQKMEWDEEGEEEPPTRNGQSVARRSTGLVGRAAGTVGVGRRRMTSLSHPSDDLLDELLYLSDGEPWHQRLGWNTVAGMISAAGREVDEFFQVFRWQPRARRPRPPEPSGGCGSGGCHTGGCGPKEDKP